MTVFDFPDRCVAMETRVPLRLRIPNPPVDYVERELEERLREALECRVLTYLYGPAGAGKTSLVARVFEAHLDHSRRDVLYVDLADADTGGSVLSAVMRAAGECEGSAGDAISIPDDPRERATAAIDCADEGGWFVVVDHLEASDLDSGEAQEALELVARYGRDAHWIVIGREPPARSEVERRAFHLEAFREDRTEERPPEEGSQRPGSEPAADDPRGDRYEASGVDWARRGEWDEFPDPLRRSLAWMIHSAVPISETLLGEMLGTELAEFAREFGLFERREGGLELRDEWADELLEEVPNRETRGLALEATEALEESDRPEGWVCAARTYRRLGDAGRLAKLLEERTADLIRAGCAGDLWDLVERTRVRRLDEIRLQCAAHGRIPEAVDAVEPPDDPTHRETRLWVEVLLERNELDRAAEVAEQHFEDLPVGSERRARTGLLLAQCLGRGRRRLEARRVLESIATDDSRLEARRQLALCIREKREGDLESGRRRLEEVRGEVSAVANTEDAKVALALARAYSHYGAIDEALELVERIRRLDALPVCHFYCEDRVDVVEAYLRLSTGELQEAQRLVDAVSERFVAHPRWSLTLRTTASAIARFREGVGRAVELLRENFEAARSVNRPLAQNAAVGMARLELRMYGAEDAPPLRELPETDSPYFRQRRRAGEALRAARRGDSLPDDLERAPRARAAACVVDGELETAREILEDAIDGAREEGRRVRALDFADQLAAILLSTDFEKLRGRYREIRRNAESVGAELVAERARWFASFLDGGPALDDLVERGSDDAVLPSLARFARDLMGVEVGLDRYEREIADELSRRLAFVAHPVRADSSFEESWWIDERTRRVVLEVDRSFDFSTRPTQYGVLEVLADSEGRASKEELLRRVWEIDDPHPLEHENRLRLSVHKIRNTIESQRGEPRFLQTVEEGYALGPGAVRVREP